MSTSDCRASIEGWCEVHSTSDGPAWCVDALRDALRRSRFHERENYHRWQCADAVIEALGIEEWHPDDGDRRCQKCGRLNPVWFTDSAVWNALMPNDGILCPTCFMLAADERMGGPIWRVTSEPRPEPHTTHPEHAPTARAHAAGGLHDEGDTHG